MNMALYTNLSTAASTQKEAPSSGMIYVKLGPRVRPQIASINHQATLIRELVGCQHRPSSSPTRRTTVGGSEGIATIFHFAGNEVHTGMRYYGYI